MMHISLFLPFHSPTFSNQAVPAESAKHTQTRQDGANHAEAAGEHDVAQQDKGRRGDDGDRSRLGQMLDFLVDFVFFDRIAG